MTTGSPPSAAPHPYATHAYAQALGQGEALAVPEFGGWVVRRAIAAGGEDAAGPYPLAAPPQDADLDAGLAALREAGLVSLVLAPDPLRGPPDKAWAAAFAVRRPLKTHRLIDPAAGAYDPTRHHRERIRRGLRRCRVERLVLSDQLQAWRALYAGLVESRAIRGPAAFPPAYFTMLAQEPRIEAFAAFVEGDIAGMTLWFAHDGIVYNHLTACNARGYANGAAFALYDSAIGHFRGRGVVNLGGGAGLVDDPQDGLAMFKSGFANARAQGWLCGAVLDPERYAALSAGRDTAFFPAYRS